MTGTGIGLARAAIEAHGGTERWRRVRELVVRLRSGGFALAARWQRNAFREYEARISVGESRLLAHPYGGAGRTGVFEHGNVRIVSAKQTLVEERLDARAYFGRFRRRIWWDRCDALFFGAYAIWNYFQIPFLFERDGFELTELESWREQGETWRRLRAVFPPDVPTHSQIQDFYFDSSFRLRRHDYTAEVFGSWARAAHYCLEQRTYSGLVFACKRRVFPRKADNQSRGFPTLVWIDVDDVQVIDAGSSGE